MEALIEILFQFLLEILLALLQVVGELLLSVLGEVVVHGLQRIGAAFGLNAAVRSPAPGRAARADAWARGGARAADDASGVRAESPARRWFAAHWWPVLGHAAAGLLAGGISLWLVPQLLVRAEWLRLVNVLATPLAAGALMGLWGGWRRRRGLPVLRVDAFATAYVFAFCMAAVRFFGGA